MNGFRPGDICPCCRQPAKFSTMMEVKVADTLQGELAPEGNRGYDVSNCVAFPHLRLEVKGTEYIKKRNQSGSRGATDRWQLTIQKTSFEIADYIIAVFKPATKECLFCIPVEEAKKHSTKVKNIKQDGEYQLLVTVKAWRNIALRGKFVNNFWEYNTTWDDLESFILRLEAGKPANGMLL